jgi:type VI secretion system protein VasD
MNLPKPPTRIWIWVGLLALAPLLGKAPPPAPVYPPPRLELSFDPAAGLNRDPVGNPLSVVVRVYQLKDKVEFSKLSFDLASSGRPEPEILGQECLGKVDYTLVPGSPLKESEPLLPETRYVGVVAFFRHPDPHHWRCLARIDQPKPPTPDPPKGWLKRKLTKKKKPAPAPPNPHLAFKAQDCYLQLVQPRPEPIPGQPETFRPDCAGDPVSAPETGTILRAAR